MSEWMIRSASDLPASTLLGGWSRLSLDSPTGVDA